MSLTATKHWIDGEEFANARRELLAAGHSEDSPEVAALWERLHQRDDYIWAKHAPRLMISHKNQWAAFTITGEAVVQPTASEALSEATGRFGPSNFAFGKLADFPGYDVSRC